PGGDLLDQLFAGDRHAGAIRQALEAVQQAVRIPVRLRDRAALGAGVAAIKRGIVIALHLDRPVSIKRDHDRAAGIATATYKEALFHRRVTPGGGYSPSSIP